MTPPAGDHTLREILGQAEGWRAAGEAVLAHGHVVDALRDDQAAPVVFTACGSPYLLCQTAAAVYRSRAGRPAYAIAASELLLHRRSALPSLRSPVVVAVSRSGETDELVAACRGLGGDGSHVIAVTLTADASLATVSNETVVIPDTAEVSLAQTRSFSAMLLATLGLVAAAHGTPFTAHDLDRLVADAPDVLARSQAVVEAPSSRTFQRAFFLGSGPLFGLAGEGAMKMIEMALIPASAYRLLEFRHGPQALVDEDALVVGLLPPEPSPSEVRVLGEARDLGASVLVIGGQDAPGDGLAALPLPTSPAAGDGDVGLVRYLPALQLLAYHQAVRKHLDPDLPRNLERFVRLPEMHNATAPSARERSTP